MFVSLKGAKFKSCFGAPVLSVLLAQALPSLHGKRKAAKAGLLDLQPGRCAFRHVLGIAMTRVAGIAINDIERLNLRDGYIWGFP